MTPPYQELFPRDTAVRIADLDALTEFKRAWKHHHPLGDDQLEFASTIATVVEVSFYHGGDVLYRLEDVPGLWHEACLRTAD